MVATARRYYSGDSQQSLKDLIADHMRAIQFEQWILEGLIAAFDDARKEPKDANTNTGRGPASQPHQIVES